jgi:hypothetical protein
LVDVKTRQHILANTCTLHELKIVEICIGKEEERFVEEEVLG